MDETGNNTAETARHRVLITDDAQDVHRLLGARLKQERLELLNALDGKSAIDLARSEQPSLILLDLDMPGMDGFEVLRHLKASDDTHGIPVIVLSGLQSPADKVTAFDLGAVDYVTKPFDLMELRVRVRSALRMADLVSMLAQRAHIDGLTGLYNRVAFEERWAQSFAENQRHGKPLSLTIFDLDHFKSINDTYGHPAGDEALRTFGRLLQRECRQSDVPCRFGGEEFVMIMPETGSDDAAFVCNRIREELEAIEWPAHPERKVTVSCGVLGATSPATMSASDWIQATDEMLYAAKNGGRNRVMSSRADKPDSQLRSTG
ncbi:MAG: diguanylate cyclase [Planctomycetota bacterium]